MKACLGLGLLFDNQASGEVFQETLNFTMLGQTGFSSSYLCVDASTRFVHTEEDFSMTHISVPDQLWENKHDGHLQFLFQINGHETLSADMKSQEL